MKIIFKCLTLLLLLCSFNISNTNAKLVSFSGDTTIRQLQTNIWKLNNINNNLQDDIYSLNHNYNVKKYLKINLTDQEIKLIKSKIWFYNDQKIRFENILKTNSHKLQKVEYEKKQLMYIKRDFYKFLLWYIHLDYKNEYFKYIKEDLNIYNKQNIIKSNIISSREKLDKKVEALEDRITTHKVLINHSINEIIKNRITQKINNLKYNKKYIILDNETKIKVLEKTIVRLKIKKQNYISTNNMYLLMNKNIADKKIKSYDYAILMINEYKETLIR